MSLAPTHISMMLWLCAQGSALHAARGNSFDTQDKIPNKSRVNRDRCCRIFYAELLLARSVCEASKHIMLKIDLHPGSMIS